MTFWRWSEPKSRVKIFSREEWNARLPIQIVRRSGPIDTVVCTYTHTDTCFTIRSCRQLVRELQDRHMDTAVDIRYNYIIGGDGNAYEGRGWRVRPDLELSEEHRHLEDTSLLIAVCGNYSTPTPPKFLREPRELLIKYGVSARIINKVYKHVQQA